MAYTNDQRQTRTGHKDGGSTGKQGGHGTGQVKCSADGASKPAASFKDASAVIGEEIVGELKVPGVSIVKGASAPASPSNPKGSSGKPQGGKVQKSKDAIDAGR